MKNTGFLYRFALVALAFSMTACSTSAIQTEKSYEDKTKSELYKNGSLASDAGGFDLLRSSDKKRETSGIGVNGYLWRAALDTVSFMPIASADPFGGMITTDWHSAPEAQNERAKLNVFILDRDLRSDGVRVTVFRQVKDDQGTWIDAPVQPATATSLEETILTRARQLRLAQKTSK